MSLAMSKEDIAADAMKQAMTWLDERGHCYRHLPPSQLKIGPINFWPRTGTITVDGECQRRPAKGLPGLDEIFADIANKRRSREGTIAESRFGR